MGLEIDKNDKPVMILALLGFIFALGIIIFCIPNWMKPVEEVNWWFLLAIIPGALGIIGTMAYIIISGIVSMAKPGK